MADWENEGVEIVDERCPLHGDNAVGNCWPCHVAGVLADPESCEPIDGDE
jgi:hypothetical protein